LIRLFYCSCLSLLSNIAASAASMKLRKLPLLPCMFILTVTCSDIGANTFKAVPEELWLLTELTEL